LPLYLSAAFYGIVTAFGLLAGAVVGLVARPRQRIVAAVMAFGSGTLLSALAFDLCQEAYHHIHESHGSLFTLIVGFLSGGLIFVLAEGFIDSKGGFLRREGTRNSFLKEKKAERAADILDKLAEVEIMRSLPPAEVQAIVPHVQEVTFSDGEVVFSKGTEGDALYMVIDGEARVMDNSRLLATLGHGAAFGEMALLTGEPRNATVQAGGTLRCYRIGRDDFNHLMGKSRALADGVHRLLAERIEARKHLAEPAQTADTWRKVAAAHLDRGLSAAEEKDLVEKHTGSSAPVAIFLGALVDGVPESVVIGATLMATQAPSLSFMAAVFMSNFPEAMSSASGMTKAGFTRRRIMGMWCGLVVLAGVSAALGNLFLSGASPTTLAFAESLAAGGILALLANTMMPEAFEMGGRMAAISTIVGFLAAFLLSVMH